MNDQQNTNLAKIHGHALQMQQDLAKQSITIEEDGVRIVLTGDQQVVEFTINGTSNSKLNEIINKALRQSQGLAAKALIRLGSLKSEN